MRKFWVEPWQSSLAGTTDLLTNLEHQNSKTGELFVIQKRRSRGAEALKLGKSRSGSWEGVIQTLSQWQCLRVSRLLHFVYDFWSSEFGQGCRSIAWKPGKWPFSGSCNQCPWIPRCLDWRSRNSFQPFHRLYPPIHQAWFPTFRSQRVCRQSTHRIPLHPDHSGRSNVVHHP